MGQCAWSSVVGFRPLAPWRPWANVCLRKIQPSLSNKSTKLVLQMAGRSIWNGGAGCSSRTLPPDRATGMHSHSPRRRRQLPTATCSISASDSPGNPQHISALRSGRGPRKRLPTSSCKAANRALDHVSHGGPSNNAKMRPARAVVMRKFQMRWLCTSMVSLIAVSMEMTKIASLQGAWLSVTSACICAWKSSARLRPA